MTTTAPPLDRNTVLRKVRKLQRAMNGASVYLPQIQAALNVPESGKVRLWKLLDELVQVGRLEHRNNSRSGYSLPKV